MTPDEIEKDRARIVMTDADLKQLLTAATKGPWGSFFEIDHYSVWSDDGRKVGTAIMGFDARLIALSPTLAQEVLTLRAEVARLRGHNLTLTVEIDAAKLFGGGFFGKEALEGAREHHRELARAALGEKNDG